MCDMIKTVYFVVCCIYCVVITVVGVCVYIVVLKENRFILICTYLSINNESDSTASPVCVCVCHLHNKGRLWSVSSSSVAAVTLLLLLARLEPLSDRKLTLDELVRTACRGARAGLPLNSDKAEEQTKHSTCVCVCVYHRFNLIIIISIATVVTSAAGPSYPSVVF